ncbi:hypothetical protein CDAR_78582 [Caerostris darwini]|uniref:Cytochrome P450 n=1 Tax=Caerostris darwini TaxID=1538125 RepID=A0AAV4QXH5_9ARAC|nr:hypothetical protein CDAR_78582 [Caerostris darwini]
MPKPKCNRILFFISVFWSLYRQSRPESPLTCGVRNNAALHYRQILEFRKVILQGIYGSSIVEAKEKIGQVTLGLKPAIIFGKAETVEVILSSSTQIEKANEYKFLHPWLGTGLFTSPAAKWRHRRKLLTPTFHFTILEDFIPVYQEQSSVFVSKLQDLTKEPWVDIVPLLTSYTLDIICLSIWAMLIHAI